MTYEELKAKTVEELKALCKDLGLRGYSQLNEEELIEKLLNSGKLEEEQPQETETETETEEQDNSDEEEKIHFNARRKVVSIIKHEVLGKFTLTKAEYEKDTKIQHFVKIGFVDRIG